MRARPAGASPRGAGPAPFGGRAAERRGGRPRLLRSRRALLAAFVLAVALGWFGSHLGGAADVRLRLGLPPPEAVFDMERLRRLNVSFYAYPPQPPLSAEFAALHAAFRRSPLAVDRPEAAALLVPGVDTRNNRNWLVPGAADQENGDTLSTARALWSLPAWNGGRNHLVFQTHDLPNVNFNFGEAVLLKTSLSQGTLRRGFDVVPPLYKGDPGDLELGEPSPRPRYLLTFKGKRYLGGLGEFRSRLASLDNGGDVKVCTRCHEGADASAQCAAEERRYHTCDYDDMMRNTTFALVPGGRQHATFRLREAIAAGAIPVIFDDRTVLPFDEVVPWADIAVWHREDEPLSELPARLRQMTPARVQQLRETGRHYLLKYMSSADAIVAGVAEVFRRRCGEACQ